MRAQVFRVMFRVTRGNDRRQLADINFISHSAAQVRPPPASPMPCDQLRRAALFHPSVMTRLLHGLHVPFRSAYEHTIGLRLAAHRDEGCRWSRRASLESSRFQSSAERQAGGPCYIALSVECPAAWKRFSVLGDRPQRGGGGV